MYPPPSTPRYTLPLSPRSAILPLPLGGRYGTSYGSDAELAAGYLVYDSSDAYHGVFQYNQGSYFSMAEEKPDSKFSDSGQGNEVLSTTTPDAYVAE